MGEDAVDDPYKKMKMIVPFNHRTGSVYESSIRLRGVALPCFFSSKIADNDGWSLSFPTQLLRPPFSLSVVL